MTRQDDAILAAVAGPEVAAVSVAMGVLGRVVDDAIHPLRTLGDVARQSASLLLAPMQQFGVGLNALTAALTAPTQALQGMTSGIAQLVQASNPAEMMRFQFALQDLTASVGRMFEPVIEAVAQVADVFNRVFTEIGPTITPIMQQFGQILAEVGGVIANAVRPVLAAFAPVLQTVADLFRQLTPQLTPVISEMANLFTDLLRAAQPLLEQAIPLVVSAMRWLAETVQQTIVYMRSLAANPVESVGNTLQGVLGFATFNPGLIQGALENQAQIIAQLPNWAQMQQPLPQSQTTAARPAQMQNQVDQLGEQARLAAFGARSQAEIQQEQLNAQQAGNVLLQQIANQLAQAGAAPLTPAEQATIALAGQAGI